MFFIYVLYNKDHGKIYIGQTNDLGKRIAEHNDPSNARHTFTGQFNWEWVIIYKEEATTRREALKREKQLKSYRGREFIKKFIPR